MQFGKHINWQAIAFGVFLGIALALVFEFSIGPNFRPMLESNLTFEDLVALLLTLIAILIGVVGLFVATLAFFGYKNLEDMTKERAARQVTMMLTSNQNGGDHELLSLLKGIVSEIARDEAVATALNVLSDSNKGIIEPKEWGNINSEYGEGEQNDE